MSPGRLDTIVIIIQFALEARKSMAQAGREEADRRFQRMLSIESEKIEREVTNKL